MLFVSSGHHFQWTPLPSSKGRCRGDQGCSPELSFSPCYARNGGQSSWSIPACSWVLWAFAAISRDILMLFVRDLTFIIFHSGMPYYFCYFYKYIFHNWLRLRRYQKRVTACIGSTMKNGDQTVCEYVLECICLPVEVFDTLDGCFFFFSLFFCGAKHT